MKFPTAGMAFATPVSIPLMFPLLPWNALCHIPVHAADNPLSFASVVSRMSRLSFWDAFRSSMLSIAIDSASPCLSSITARRLACCLPPTTRSMSIF